MDEIKYSKPVKPSDQVRFRCKRCAECCRHMEGVIPLESKDAFYLAKHLNLSMTEFIEKYTDAFVLGSVDYPVLMLKAVGPKKSCIFLKGNHCTVQEVKPRACRMYPFWIDIDTENGGFAYNFSTDRPHHPNGTLIRVRHWMEKYFTEEDKAFLSEDWRSAKEIGPIFDSAKLVGVPLIELQKEILVFKYFAFEYDKPFLEQQRRNNAHLKSRLEQLINNFIEHGGKK